MTDLPPPPPPGSVPPPPPPGGTPPAPPAPPTPPVPPAPPAPPTPPAPPAPPTGGGIAPPPAGRPSANNGLAIAALILGILTFVCLGPIAGVLAVVFGFLGLKKAKEMGGTGKGMSIAGIVLGIVGTIVSILFLVLVVFAADQASDSISDSVKNWSGEANASDYNVTVEKCGVDKSFDTPSMTIKVTNKTSVEKSYIFNYEFRSGSGALIDSGGSFPETIPANGSKLVEITSFEDATPNVKCEITSVENWFN